MKQAEEFYRRSIAAAPHFPMTRLNLGVLLAVGKRFDETEAEYRAATAYDPNSPKIWSSTRDSATRSPYRPVLEGKFKLRERCRPLIRIAGYRRGGAGTRTVYS